MGLKKLDQIIEAAKNIDVDNYLPAAIICNATRPNQKNIITTLGELNDAAAEAETPAIIVLGKVVNFTSMLKKSTFQEHAVQQSLLTVSNFETQ